MRSTSKTNRHPIVQLIVFIIIFVSFRAVAQFQFTRIGLDSGLSSEYIWSITEDNKGNIWIGGISGLEAFDGRQVFKPTAFMAAHSTPLPNSSVSALTQDRHGTLWVGMQNSVAMLQRNEDAFQLKDTFQPEDEITSYSFSHFYPLSSGSMLSAAAGTVYFHRHASTEITEIVDRDVEAQIAGFFTHSGDPAVLFSDWKGYRLSNDGQILDTLHFIDAPTDRPASALVQLDENRLFVAAAHGGIYEVNLTDDSKVNRRKEFDHIDSILTLGKLGQETLLIGTQVGLFVGKASQHQFEVESIAVEAGGKRAQYIYTSFEASDGTLLLGTDRGLYKAEPASAAIHNIDVGKWQENPDTYALAEDHTGILWLSSDGLIRVSPGNKKLPLTEEINNLPPANHILAEQDILWVSHVGGVSIIDPVTLTVEHLPLLPYRLNCQDKDMLVAYHGIRQKRNNKLAFALDGGVIEVAPDSRKVEYLPLGQGCRPYSQLAEDNLGNLFTSRSNEIWRISADNQLSQHIELSHRYLFLFSVNLQGHDHILATTGNGIFRWEDTTRELRPFDIASSNWVDIRETESAVWVSTLQNGIHRIDKQTLNVRLYSQTDGLLSRKYNLMASTSLSGGRLAFAGERGVDIISPEIMPDYEALDIQISSIKYEVDGDSQIVLPLLAKLDSERLVIPSNAKNIEFWLASSNHRYAANYRFRYYLEGFNHSWRDLPRSTSRFSLSALPVGQYSLHLEIISPSGARQKVEKPLLLVVEEPSWDWWFKEAYVVISDFFNIWVTLFQTAQTPTKLIYLFLAAILIAIIAIWRWYSSKIRQKALEREIGDKTKFISKQNQELAALLNYREDLLANIAHEIKTPLTLLLGVVTGKYGEGERQAKLKRMVFRISLLLDNMLTLSKSNTVSAEKQVTYVYRAHEFVEFYLTTYNGFSSAGRLTLLDNQPANVCCQPDTLDKIITNLINNAIKYSPPHSRIAVSANQREHCWQFRVTNEGSGIAEEQLESVFKRYVQIDQESRSYGLGLGLPLVKQLVESAGGTIEIDSEQNKQTRVTVSIPIAKETITESETRGVGHDELSDEYRSWLFAELDQQSEDIPSVELNSTINDKVPLVYCIDDNRELLLQLQEQLQTHYQLRCFNHPAEALDNAEQEIPDLIISDLMMPQMNGLEVVKAIRQSELLSHIPVILLTARSDHQSQLEGLQALADDYITKPYQPAQLAAKIDNLVAIRQLIKTRFNIDIERDLQTQDNPVGALKVIFDEAAPEQKRFMQKVIDCLQAHLHEPDFSVKNISATLHLSDSQIRRKVKAISGYAPQEILRIIRLEAAAAKIREGENLKSIAHDCGFSSQSHMGASFKAYFGMTPKQYRQKTT